MEFGLEIAHLISACPRRALRAGEAQTVSRFLSGAKNENF